MMSKILIRRAVMMLASLLIGGLSVVPGKAQIPVLSVSQKSDVVEALLELENEAQRLEFVNIKGISSANIEFLSSERISKLGLSLVPVAQIDSLRVDHVVEYLLIRPIKYLGEGRVVVKLARVIEGRPCFGPSFSSEESFTYEFTNKVQDGSERWVGRVVSKSLPFSLSRSSTSQRLR